MTELSLDFQGLIAQFDPAQPSLIGAALLQALGDVYEDQHGDCALYVFEQSGATYLFDFSSMAGLPQEDRTVAAWALTPTPVGPRDANYQRGYPMLADAEGSPVDRGHLIPRLSGGEYGPNIFRQDRALNRGWSAQGKVYRSMERQAAQTPGAFYFAHLLYADDTAYPAEIETGLLVGSVLRVERFGNQPGRH